MLLMECIRRAGRGAVRAGRVIGLLTLQASQQAPAVDTDAYTVAVWGIEAGLPPFSVRAITQTEDGYLWVGTFNGLSRFDGIRFTSFTMGETPGLLSDNITALYPSRDGTLWIGTDGAGLIRYRQGRFEPVATSIDGRTCSVHALLQDSAGTLWAGTSRGLLRWTGEALEPFPGSTFDPGAVRAIRAAPDGRLWIGTARGVARVYEDGIELRYPTPRPVAQLDWAPDGQLWVLYTSRRMATLTPDPERLEYATPESFRITALRLVHEGAPWYGVFQQGLFHAPWLGAEPRKVADTPGLVNALYEDRDGNLWAGVETSGLWRIRRGRVRLLNEDQGLQPPAATSLAPDPTGVVWVGTFGNGLHAWLNGRFEPVHVSPDAGNVGSVLRTSAGSLWCGAAGGGLFVRHPNAPFVPVPGTETDKVRALLETRDGRVGVGTWGGGLLVFEDETVRRYTRQQGLSNDRVLCLAEGADGTLWIGTEHGLNHLRREQVRSFFRQDGLGADVIRSLRVTSDGTLWIGTLNGGLTRHRDGRFETLTARQGLRSSHIEQIFEDHHHRLWLGSSQGILRVGLDQLHACLDRSVPSVHCTVLGPEEGFPAIAGGTGFHPSVAQVASGDLWFCTGLGVAVIDPDEPGTSSNPPEVYLESLWLDGKVSDAAPPYPVADWPLPVRVPAGTSRLEFKYAGLSFMSPTKVTFRYQLEGYDSAWIEAGTDHTAHYTRVPPGAYRFRVTAANNEGVWNETGATLAITVLPRWWQRSGFHLAALLGVLGVGAMAYRVRIRQIQNMERMRLRIARDLHDDVGSNLGSIALLSQVASRPEEPGSARDLQEIERVAQETAEAIRDIVWLINPDEDRLERLVLRMRETAGLLLHGVSWQFHAPEQFTEKRLSTEFKRHVLLIFKEALHNIRKHARADGVQIQLAIQAGRLELRITDDGVGFDPAALRTGQGLENLRRRAAELGSSLEIHSQAQGGTTLHLSAPLQ